MTDENFLRMPAIGDYQLRVLSSNVVELMMVTRKDPDPAPLTAWNFIDATGAGSLPPTSSFTVSANGSALPVTAVGFKRRVLYAPLRTRDLRVANWLSLQLGAGIPAGAVVTVQNPGGALWGGGVNFTATNSTLRYSPAIHVNQAGYVANFSKKAMVGQYLGTLGEMAIPSSAGFQLVNAASGAVAFSGSLIRRPDVGYSYTPTPYQQVFEADFTSFNTPGEYKLVVPGLGASFPFFIDEGMAATYARTYALGIYHQRCGTDNVRPYTRHTHGPCHTNLVMIPSSPGPEQDFVNYVLNGESAGATHPAPRMVNVGASLYPFVNTAPFDARGGHHDAGDYSKYTTSVSLFTHNLIFAVDSLPGVKDLDNLGIPESGDGISDIMQEAKWEADYLAKLQDADGGFYFIVYPRARQYELDVTPDHGDLQLVLPKNTSATAAAVGALADMASSPTFKATYPAAASNYLAKAVKGWQFLQTAIARYGKDGAYQMVTFSGNVFGHDDELAWAAAALYNATGDPAYNTALRSYMPNPNSQSLRRWDWWSMFGGYGCATRDYGFAVRSGKLTTGQIDPAYLALCEAEIRFAGSNSVDWSAKMAYGSSFTDESKGIRVAGWFFSGEWTLDPAAAWVIDPSASMKQLYLDCILKNYNYEMGCNPVNVTYLTGLGSKRQREIVHQYALNDYRVLPPGGIPLGNIQAQYDYLQNYKGELAAISYPGDDGQQGAPYAYYDRWADTFNVSTEFVVSQTAKTLPAAAMLMAMTAVKTQAWNSSVAMIVNLPATAVSTQAVTPSLVAPGISAADLAKARIVWEAREQEPFIGPSYTFKPLHAGVQWVEAEAQLPDGRRLVALTNYTAIQLSTNTIEQYQTIPLGQNTNVVAWYKFDGTFADATGREPNLVPAGTAAIDGGSFVWPSRTNGAALRVTDLPDGVTVSLPNGDLSSTASSALSIEAMFYVNKQVAYGRGNADLFVLSKNWSAELALRHNIWTAGPAVSGGGTVIADNVTLGNYLKPGQWQHLKIRLDRTSYTLALDGVTVATVASGDLANWGGGGTAAFRIGSFDGWVDEIVVKNEGGGVTPPVTNPPPPTGSAVISISTSGIASEAGPAPANFIITRDTIAATNLTVNLNVTGTATSGADYLTVIPSVTIPAGSLSATLTVTPVDDAIYEGSETVIAGIAASTAYALGNPSSAPMTLADNDVDSRPPPPGQTNYITSPQTVTTNIVALYHLDGNLADASGRFANLALGVSAVADNGNLAWMNTPSGSALRVFDLGDNATVTLNNVNLFTASVTDSLGVEVYVFVNSFMAYSHKPATIFKLSKRWDAQMIYNQDTWQQTPEVWGGVAKVIDVPALAPYLQTNCWQKIGVFLDETGYFVKVNDVEVARTASTDITKWAGAGNVDVEIGSFDGWIDEIAVRSNVKGAVTPPPPANQTITFGALATKTFGDAAFTLSATASSGLPVSYSSGNTSVATISGSTVTIIGAGTAVITATQVGNSNYNAATPVTQTLTVNKATATVTLGNLSAVYDGTAKQASVITTPGGLSVSVTYNGSATLPVNSGSYSVVATVNDANYSGSASGVLNITLPTNLSQTITFGALPAKTFGDAAFTLSATASSGLPVSYSSGNASVATISGSTVTIVGAGAAVITATQGGDATYNPAAPVSQTLTVSKAAATVTLNGLSAVYDGAAKSATATTSPAGLTVSLTYNGNATAPANAGSYAVVATINSANYSGSASGTLTISQASQAITFGALPVKNFSDVSFALSATASSGLAVSYTSGNSSVASISGSTVTIIGAGAAVISATQTGNANYAAATPVSQTLTVNQATATVTLGGLSAIYDGTAKQATVTTTPSGLATTVTYNGGAALPVNAGSYAVAATVSNANYFGSASGTLVISQPSQTISFGALAAKTFGAAPFTLTATASSGLPVSYSSGNTAVATTSGSSVTIVGAGTAVITATQAGNSNYAAATPVSQTLTVSKAAATVALSGLSAVYDGTGKSATVSTTPSGLSVAVTYNGGAALPVNAGSYAVVATVSDANYSGSASGTLVISQPNQTITFAALSVKTFGDAAFTLGATASSGLPVSYSSGNTSVATISGGTVTIVGAGTAVITATQAGNANYAAATPVSQVLTVNKASATVTLGGLSAVYDGAAKSATVSTTPSGLTVNVTYSGSATPPVNAGSYAVAATVNSANYSGSASGTLTISQTTQTLAFAALPAKTFGDAAFALGATASSGLAVSYSSGNPAVATISGSTVTIIGAGTAVITASQAGNTNFAAATPVSQTLTVNKATATITLAGLSATYDGVVKSATATTSPAGLPVGLTYNGSATAPSAVGSYAVAATISSANYTGSASGTLVINKATATVTLSGLSAVFDGTAKPVSVSTTPAGLTVNVTYNGSSIAPSAAGSYAVAATVNDASYAGSANGNLLITQPTNQSQTISFGALPAKTFGDAAFTVSATASSGLAVSFASGNTSVATISGNTVTIVGAGTAVITATQTGDATYNPATPVSQVLTVSKAAATVTLGGFSATYDGTAKSATATTSPAGLTVGLTYNGSASLPVNVGSYAVVATITSANYSGSASGTLTISPASQTITFGALAAKTFGGATFALGATASSGLAVSYASGNPAVATVSGSTVTIVGAGTAVITATQSGNANYAAATPVSQTLTVNKATATITLAGLSATYDGAAKSATATTSPSGLPVNLTYDGSATAPSSVGSYAVAAALNHSNYIGSASGTLTINKAAATVTLGGLSAVYDGAAKSATVSTTPGGLSVNVTYNASATAPVNAGSYAVVATVNDANYSGSANGTLTITQPAQTISFGALAARTFGDAPFTLNATASSGLPVSYSSGNASVATVSGGTVTIVGAGAAVITASQTGNSNYAAAASVSQTLTVNKAAATVTLGNLSGVYDGAAKPASVTTTPAGLATTVTYNGGATLPLNAGSYAVVATVNAANYSGSASGTLVISQPAQTISFGALPAKTFGDAAFTLGATASSGLAVSYSSGNASVATVSGSTVTIVGAGTAVITATQGGNGNYLAATPVSQTLTVNKASGTITLGGLSATYDGTAKSATATTTPSGLPVTLTYNGSSTAPSAVGSYAVAAAINSANYSGSASGTLTINKATAVVTLSGLNAIYDGAAKTAVVTTTPASLTVDVTYNGSASAPVNVGSYLVQATVNDASYAGSANGVLNITQPTNQSQTITFGALAAKTFGDAAFNLSATASSGLPVSFSSGNTSVATVSGNTLTMVGAGTAAITATQGGGSNYNPATPVLQTLTVSKASATVTLGGLSAVYDGAAKPVTATTSPGGLTVNVTYNGSGAAPVNAGSYAVVATLSSANYSGSASGTLVISQPSQTITFGAFAAKTFGDTAFTLSATASSGLPVSYASGNPSVVTISGSTVTIVGAGTVVITASQAGNANYTAATPVSQSLVVSKASATVTLSGLSAVYNGVAKSATATTTPAGLPVSLTYDGSASAPVNAGNYAVVATINHSNYTGGASGTLVISQPNQTITFGALAAKTYGNAAFNLSATASSGLPVSFASGDTSVATISGSTVTIVGAGTAVITASQTGNSNYLAATSVSQSLTVNKANATITLGGLSTSYDGAAKNATTTTSPGGLPTTLTYNGSATAPIIAGSYAVAATINHNNYTGSTTGTLTINKGTATVTLSGLSAVFDGTAKPVSVSTTPAGLSVGVTYNGSATAPAGAGSYAVVATVSDANYAGSASGTLLITQPTNQSQTITFAPLPTKTYGDASFTLSASSSAGLPVSFASGNPSVAIVSGNTVTIVGAGAVVITATQNGNGTYNPAVPVAQTLTVSKAAATVALSGLTATFNGSAKSAAASTSPAGLPVDVTYDGSATAPVNTGSYFVSAVINHNNYAGSASGTLTVNPAAATVTLSGLSAIYDGTAKSVIVSTVPAGLPVSVTYDGGVTAPASVGSYAVAATVNNPNYTGSASGTLTIADAPTLVTLTIVKEGQGAVTPDLDGQFLAQGTNVTLTATASNGWNFSGWSAAGNISSNAELSLTLDTSMTVTAMFADDSAPVVNITSVVTNAGRGTAGSLTLTGTASDNAGVQAVEYAIVSGGVVSDYQPATGTTNWTIDLPPLPYGTNTVRVRARDLHGNLSSIATRTFTYIATGTFTLVVSGAGTVLPDLNGQVLELGKTYTLKATPAAGNVFMNWDGSVYSTNATLNFVMSEGAALTAIFRETNKPLVAIVSPLADARVTSDAATFTGTASDASGVARVEFAMDDGAFLPATATTDWSAPVTLHPGTNVFRVRSVDNAGNISLTASRPVFYAVVSALTLGTEGGGKISGATNGQMLEVGRTYQLTATPVGNSLFAGWSGGMQSSAPTLSFVMQPNLWLQARFVTNSFVALQGTYQALFFEPDAVRHPRSGAVRLTLTGLGVYSASVKLGAKSFNLLGEFDEHGCSQKTLVGPGGERIVLNLRLDTTNLTDRLEGSVTNNLWRADLSGYRLPVYSAKNPPPVKGNFTFVIPNLGNPDQPVGHGAGSMSVSAAGLGTMSGRLGDGTPFTCSATVSRDGEFPLYAQLYKGNNGSILSWLSFTNRPTTDFDGLLSWIKPASAPNTSYASGFAVNASCLGSAYDATNAMFTFNHAAISFSGGELGAGFTNAVRVEASGELANLAANPLVSVSVPATGLFYGWVMNPATGRFVAYRGAAFQKLGSGFGHCDGALQSAALRLLGAP